jgi:LysM repeat protein
VPRKLAAAGVAGLLLLPLGVIVAHAQDTAPQPRYVEQPGDTPNSIAAQFGIDPAAILSASAIDHRPSLTPEEIFAIPNSSESSDAATSPS